MTPRSLWLAKASDPGPLRVVDLTPERVAAIRREVERAAKRDPFTTRVDLEALRIFLD